MSHDYAPIDSNTPWWYETPSLVSQTNHMSALTGSGESNPFDITPSVSSGYFDEDDASNISDGSYTAHVHYMSGNGASAAGYHRTESNWSNSTLTNGKPTSQVMTSGTESSQNAGTLVETDVPSKPGVYTINTIPSKATKMGGGEGVKMGRGIGGPPSGQSMLRGGGARSRGVPVAPLRLEGEKPLAKAFASNTPTKLKEEGFSIQGATSLQHKRDQENAPMMEPNSPLCHSSSAANQEILQYLAPQFMQNIKPMDLLPHLKSRHLLEDSDIDFIYNPANSDRDKIKRILRTAPSKDSIDAFERFVKCFEADSSHQSHIYLAKRLRETIEKKRLYPFKRLSSLRRQGHTQSHTSHQAPPTPTRRCGQGGRGEVEESSRGGHMTRPESAPPPHKLVTTPQTTPSRSSGMRSEEDKPQVPPRLGRHKKTLSNEMGQMKPLPPTPIRAQTATDLSQSMDPIMIPRGSPQDNNPAHNSASNRGRRRSPYESLHYNPAPGNFSSLPRTSSQSSMDSTRGTKPYSSARYPSSTYVAQPTPGNQLSEKCKLSLTRNASFHGVFDQQMVTVAPIERNPAMLSEETDDDSYLYRKSGYENVVRRSHSSVHPRRISLDDDRGQSHSGTNIRRPSDEAVRAIAGLVSPPVPMTTSFSMRTHEVIMEDPSSVSPSDEWESNNRNSSPRKVPVRSHSMDAKGDARIKLPNKPFMLPPHTQQLQQESKSSSLRRGASLHGQVDMYGGEDMGMAETFDRLRAENADDDGDTVQELRSASLSRQHRRTHSYEPGLSATGKPETQRRRASEHYPAPREEAETDLIKEDSMIASATAQDLSQQKMFKKKIQWLQQKVKFTDFSEELKFDSLTRYRTFRDIIYSGTLYEKGKPRFVILLTDMLLTLKPKKKSGKIGQRQQTFIDWFTEIDCKSKRPLMLHLLSIQGKSRRTFSESFCLHYNKGSSLMKITLQAVSKEAKDIWLDHLYDAIRDCTTANAECVIPVRKNVGKVSEGASHTSLALTIVEANNIAYSAHVTTKNHYCTITLGDLRCRTPSVKAKCWPTWNYKCDFSDFNLADVLRIDFYTESITCPDDFLGYVEVNLLSASQKHQTQLGVTQMQLRKQHLPLKEGKGTLTVDFELKWDQPSQ